MQDARRLFQWYRPLFSASLKESVGKNRLVWFYGNSCANFWANGRCPRSSDENGSKKGQAKLELRAAVVQSNVSMAHKIPGVHYQFYDGLFPSIPDYKELKPIKRGVVDKVDLNLVNTSEKRSYSIVYSGYIEFPESGLVRIGIGSDDGSKLYLNNQLLIDNDLAHGLQTLTRWARVPRGLVPFRVEFIEVGGDRGLVLAAAQDIDGKKPIALKFFTDSSNKTD